MKRKYSLFIEDILDAITWIEEFTKDMDFTQFQADEKTKTAVVKKLEIIGEAAKNIPKAIRAQQKQLPWPDMAKMRDKLSHEYFGVRYDIVWKVIIDKLPGIKQGIEKLLNDLKASEENAK